MEEERKEAQTYHLKSIRPESLKIVHNRWAKRYNLIVAWIQGNQEHEKREKATLIAYDLHNRILGCKEEIARVEKIEKGSGKGWPHYRLKAIK